MGRLIVPHFDMQTQSSMSGSISKSVKYLGCSAVAGMMSRSIAHPFDTIRVISQTQQCASIRSIVASRGIVGLYQGFVFSVAGSIPIFSSFVLPYELAKYKLEQISWFQAHPYVQYTTAAVFAEVICSLFCTPTELVRQRVQLATKSSALKLIKEIYQTHGVREFQRGYTITVGMYIPFSIAYFLTLEEYKRILSSYKHVLPHQLEWYEYVFGCGLATTVAHTVANPIDVIKTRYQVGEQKLWEVVRQLIREESFGWMKRGLSSKLLLVAPALSLSGAVFETLKKYIVNS